MKAPECAGEGEHGREHAEGDMAALEQAEQAADRDAPARRHGGQRPGLPQQVDQHQRHQSAEHHPPAEDPAQVGTQRRGERGGDGIAHVDGAERLRHAVGGHQADDGRRGQRPETADRQSQQGAGGHQQGEAGRQGDHDQRQQHQQGHAQQHVAGVEAPGERRDEQAGQHREQAGHRDGLSGQALGGLQVGCNRGQQADRHEFGGDQQRHAKRHGAHGAAHLPLGRFGWSRHRYSRAMRNPAPPPMERRNEVRG